MPFNKIMDLLQLSVFIFSIIPCRVLGESIWGSNRARYNGYDLRRGPVFYEVFYANDKYRSAADRQESLCVPKPEGQYSNNGRILEKIYQAASNEIYDDAHDANFEPEGRMTVDGRYTQPTQPINILPYGSSDTTSNTKEYVAVEGSENYQRAERLDNLVESNQRNAPRTALAHDLDLRTNFLEANAGTSDDRLPNYESGKLEDKYIRRLLSAIESSARETLEKLIRRESLNQIDGRGKTSRSPRFAGSENPVDRTGMRIVLARHYETPSRSAISTFASGNWRSANHRINDLSVDQDSSRNNYVRRGSIPSVLYAPKKNVMEPKIQAAKQTVMESLRQPQESQASNANYEPPKSYSQNLIEEAKKENQIASEKAPIVASIEVSEQVTRHKVRHRHGEKPRRKHRHHHGEAGHW